MLQLLFALLSLLGATSGAQPASVGAPVVAPADTAGGLPFKASTADTAGGLPFGK